MMDRKSMEDWRTFGYGWLRRVLDANEVIEWQGRLRALEDSDDCGMLRHRGQVYGSRSLLRWIPEVAGLANLDSVAGFLREELGLNWRVVRALYFDKPPECSWSLPWHRDRTIAVKEHRDDASDFINPTTKAGIPHVVAPNRILARMLTLRFHLDDMHPGNGPLMVIPGSHDDLISDSMLAVAAERTVETLHCAAGDVLIMRPLLAHCSLHSQPDCTDHRRIIHLEIAPEGLLPKPWEWYEGGRETIDSSQSTA